MLRAEVGVSRPLRLDSNVRKTLIDSCLSWNSWLVDLHIE